MIVETLCEAVKKRNTNQKRVITSLIDAGHDVNAFDKHGDCPLSLACKNGYFDIVTYLVNEKGAYINVANNEGHTPLGLAAEHLKRDIVIFLLEQGAHIDILNSNNQTPLIIVCSRSGNYQVAKELVEHGANLTTQDKQNESALSYSMLLNNKNLVDLLRKAIIKQMYEFFQNDSKLLREMLIDSIDADCTFLLNQDHIRAFNTIEFNTDCRDMWFFTNKSIWDFFSGFEFKEKFLVDVIQYLRGDILEVLDIGMKKLIGHFPQFALDRKTSVASNESNEFITFKKLQHMTLSEGLFEYVEQEKTEKLKLKRAKSLYNLIETYSNLIAKNIEVCDQIYNAIDEKSTKLATFFKDHSI